MKFQERLCRIIRTDEGNILASDAAGRIHLFDAQLRLLRSSPSHSGAQPFYTLHLAGRWIVGRDKLGNIARWDANTLQLTHWLDARSTAGQDGLWEDEDPSLTISRGIVEHAGKLYLNNGFMQLLVIDLESFSIEDIRVSPTGDTPIEWICVDHPTLHAITDKDGRLFLGDLPSNDFPVVLKLDDKSNLHRVRYDARHDRFWVIQDEGSGDHASVSNGVVTVFPDGKVDQEYRFALDDIECLDISADGSRVYAGGFDGVIEEFDNSTSQLVRARTFGPFSHQVSDIALAEDGSMYVLCQDGVLSRIDEQGVVVDTLDFERQCIWDAAPRHDAHGGTDLVLATDGGHAVVTPRWSDLGVLELLTESVTPHDRGFSRRVGVLPDGGVCVVTRECWVRRYDHDGALVWESELEGLIHTLAVDPEGTSVVVASNVGAVEFDAATGTELARYDIDGSPVWACCFTTDAQLVIATHAGLAEVRARGSRQTVLSFEIGDYPKRMYQDSDGSLLVTGGGGVRRFDVTSGERTGHWSETLSNTCENALTHNGYLYAVTYDSQLAAFEVDTGEFLGVLEGVLPDFPKAMYIASSPDGRDTLLVGGRGGYLASFAISKDGSVAPVRFQWIGKSGAWAPPRVGVTKHGG